MATVCALSSLRSEARLDHGVWVLHLTTWKEVKWDQFAVLPMPDNIIRLLNDRCTIELEILNAGGHTADIAEAENLADTEDHPVQTRNDPTLPADLERAPDGPIKPWMCSASLASMYHRVGEYGYSTLLIGKP